MAVIVQPSSGSFVTGPFLVSVLGDEDTQVELRILNERDEYVAEFELNHGAASWTFLLDPWRGPLDPRNVSRCNFTRPMHPGTYRLEVNGVSTTSIDVLPATFLSLLKPSGGFIDGRRVRLKYVNVLDDWAPIVYVANGSLNRVALQMRPGSVDTVLDLDDLKSSPDVLEVSSNYFEGSRCNLSVGGLWSPPVSMDDVLDVTPWNDTLSPEA